MKLSILLCTVTKRVSKYLPEIITELNRQATDEVEILYLGDNKKRTVGEKRNNLIDLCKGEYFSFIDDDDKISSDYVEQLLKGIESGVDVVCFKAYRHQDGMKDREVLYNLKYTKDRTMPTHYERLPNHLMCWKKETVKSIKFENLTYGEDSEWAARAKPVAQTQIFINRVLYNYYFDNVNTETQNFP